MARRALSTAALAASLSAACLVAARGQHLFGMSALNIPESSDDPIAEVVQPWTINLATGNVSIGAQVELPGMTLGAECSGALGLAPSADGASVPTFFLPTGEQELLHVDAATGAVTRKVAIQQPPNSSWGLRTTVADVAGGKLWSLAVDHSGTWSKVAVVSLDVSNGRLEVYETPDPDQLLDCEATFVPGSGEGAVRGGGGGGVGAAGTFAFLAAPSGVLSVFLFDVASAKTRIVNLPPEPWPTYRGIVQLVATRYAGAGGADGAGEAAAPQWHLLAISADSKANNISAQEVSLSDGTLGPSVMAVPGFSDLAYGFPAAGDAAGRVMTIVGENPPGRDDDADGAAQAHRGPRLSRGAPRSEGVGMGMGMGMGKPYNFTLIVASLPSSLHSSAGTVDAPPRPGHSTPAGTTYKLMNVTLPSDHEAYLISLAGAP